VRGEVTNSIELQGNSPKYQQEYAKNDFWIEKKNLSTIFATMHHTKVLCNFFKFFCDFFIPILTGANQRK